MEQLDDGDYTIIPPEICIINEDWKNLSLRNLPNDIIEKYKDKLNWETIAWNWFIDKEFYDKYEQYLRPYIKLCYDLRPHGSVYIPEELTNIKKP